MAVIAENVTKPWLLRLICCGRDDGTECFATWEEADAVRQSYTSGPGVGIGMHDRAAILERAETEGRS